MSSGEPLVTTDPGSTADLPLISVIMPYFNGEAYLHKAVDSVLQQTYSNVELIVIDDGSTDASKHILAEYTDRLILLEQAND